jgi:hypothetical protein
MASNHTRKKFDSETTKVNTYQSTRPLEFSLDPWTRVSCTECRPYDAGHFASTGVTRPNTIEERTDIESSLFQLRNQNYHSIQLYHAPECSAPSKETRMDNPPTTLKGNPQSSWIPYTFQYLCMNPQDQERIFHQTPVDLPTRLLNKDRFRARTQLPREPESMIDTIPKIPYVKNQCNAPYVKKMNHY